MAEKARLEIYARFVKSEDNVDSEIINSNIERMIELYDTRNDWEIEK